MAGRLADERFVEDEVGFLEALFDVAERPLVGGLAQRHLAVVRRRRSPASVHFQFVISGRGGPAERRRRGHRAPRPPRRRPRLRPAPQPRGLRRRRRAAAAAGAGPRALPAPAESRPVRLLPRRRRRLAPAAALRQRAAPAPRRRGRRGGTHPDVALRARVRAARPQALQSDRRRRAAARTRCRSSRSLRPR